MKFKIFSKENHPSKLKDAKEVKLFLQFSSMEKESFSVADGTIKGTAVPYGQKTQDWRKISFQKGAFKDLKNVPLFVNHESWDVRSMIGGAEFEDGGKGLQFSASLNMKDPMVVEKIIPLIEMGVLDGVSVGAWIYRREIVEDDDGEIQEIIITEAEIYELSVVTFQAFESAKIEAKAKENKMEEEIVEAGAQEQDAEQTEAEVVTQAETQAEEAVTTHQVEAGQNGADELRLLREENARLKNEKCDSEKKSKIDELIRAGVIHRSQSDKIMKQFASADSIGEFYQDVPASYSVAPQGEESPDLTTEQINIELAKEIAGQVSGLSAEDVQKYAKR